MTLPFAIAAVAVTTLSGLLGVAFRRRPVLGQRLSCAALCLGAALGLYAAVATLGGAAPSVLQISWPVPGGALALKLDALAAIFLMPILAVPSMGSIYGLAYWPQERLGSKAIRLQLAYGLITGAMALLTLAANAILFLTAWEAITIAGFLLVLTEHEKPETQRSAFLYLATAHVGTFALFAFFCLAARQTGSFDFARWQGMAAAGPFGGWCFALLLTGFGLKAGLIPLHFWLPPAHAAAPSHVSALMSGVLLKTAIYGLLRLTGIFQAPPLSWGMILVIIGAVSGVLGVAFALGQHDLKRLLAWHSIENVGIIVMGIGLGTIGRARGDTAMALLGFSGAALHVVNHALFKSLLFLGAGSVQHACGTRELDRLGGLARSMPATAALFLVGAVAISGLPPLNGFASEWLIGLGALQALRRPAGDLAAFAILVAPVLGLIGGLAVACFVKVQGVVFLGVARSPETQRAHEPPRVMLLPMTLLALACAVIGLVPRLWVMPLARAAAAWALLPVTELAEPAGAAVQAASWVSLSAAVLLLITAVLVLVRRRLWRGQPIDRSQTWGCGYAAPTPRMQYTASSFAEMLVSRFSWALRPRVELQAPQGHFPHSAAFHTEVPDTFLERGLVPLARRIDRLAASLKSIFVGSRVQFHAVLVLASLVVILVWRFVLW